MGDSLITSVVTVLTAIVGVAIIATLVSKNANTAGVLTAGGSAFSNALGTALSPVTGGSGSFGSFTGGGALPSLNSF
jgi:PRD1 phage membrane DNA delivery